jgi:hypothetical protein
MAANMSDIKQWFEEGVGEGATHMIVVCDTYDHEDYPVFVKEGEDVREKEKSYNHREMQRVMEVYNLRMDMGDQLNQHRAFNY